MSTPQIIETERLVLRFPRLEDAHAIFENYAQDAEVTRYLIWSPHQSITETEDFLGICIKDLSNSKRLTWVITKKERDSALGMIELRIENDEANVGYVLARCEWSKGYMTEALRGVLDFAFAMADVRKIWAICDVENKASARVMEKAGMLYEGTLESFIAHPNISLAPRDVFRYAKTYVPE